MERFLLPELVKWRDAAKRKPLLLRGARQVGKTWLLKEFGARYFQDCAYIRFDRARTLQATFEREHNIQKLLTAIQLEVGFKPRPQATLIVFDEIQESPGALASLKYFCEEAPEYAIAGAGSQLRLASQAGTGFPVGKVTSLYLYPLSFLEFLTAIGQGVLTELLQSGDWQLIGDRHEALLDFLRYYYFVGGMPEIVADYAQNGDFQRVRLLQKELLQNYRDDFGKHAPPEEGLRIGMIWDSIPRQLAKENKKFIYSQVQPRMRGNDLLLAMQWLLEAGLLRHARQTSMPGIPLASYADGGFKAFLHDVGLLSALSNLAAKTLLEGSRVFEEFKGALTEQFVQQELMAYYGQEPFYWSSEKSHNEIDFLLETSEAVIPLEVKAGINVKAKSLRSYCEKYRPPCAVRSSLARRYRQVLTLPDDGFSYELLDLPLYALCQLKHELNG
ncbi:MAG: ATP-binding protein [Victivallales bacterium]|nr:ATP-binding protein [Victivallales bacterium]